MSGIGDNVTTQQLREAARRAGDAARRRLSAAVSEAGRALGPEGHRDRQGRCEALDESEGEA